MLRLNEIEKTQATMAPFRHVVANSLLDPKDEETLQKDFPDPVKTGFFPVEEYPGGSTYEALIKELRSPEFSKAVGDKLGLDLVKHPQMIVFRRWSAMKDGRVHTDGPDKVATALLYLNPAWQGTAGALRYLNGPDMEGPGTESIPPLYGYFTAFGRSDSSWHGHPPFQGERRVVQVFWLKDGDALARKAKR